MDTDVQKILRGLSVAIPLKIVLQLTEAAINFMIVRSVDPAIYGLTAITSFISNINLFFLRNSLKKTYMRRSETTDTGVGLRAAHNLMLIGVLLTLASSIVINGLTGIIYSQRYPYFQAAVWVYVMDSLLVSIYELLTVELILNFEYRMVSILDSVQLVIGSLCLGSLLNFTEIDPLLAFGVAQVLSKLVKIALIVCFLL